MPYGYGGGDGYGIALADDGSLIFPVRIDGRTSVVRAVPAPPDSRLARAGR
jgi:hypothetical protein